MKNSLYKSIWFFADHRYRSRQWRWNQTWMVTDKNDISLGKTDKHYRHLTDNNIITPEDQCTPTHVLNAIQSSIKEEENVWYFRYEVMSDFQQQPNEQVHVLNTRITTLFNNCKFQNHQTKETIKITLLQHAVKFYEARDWIRLQDQTQLTYSALLQHCKTLKQCCKQFQKAKLWGHAELTTLSAATLTTFSVYQDVLTTTHIQYPRCGYSHPWGNCPASNKECYNCHGIDHYTALCRQPWGLRKPRDRRRQSRLWQRRSSSHRQRTHSPSRSRQSSQRNNSHSPSTTCRSNRYRRSPTLIRHQVSYITFNTQSSQEGRLLTIVAAVGHIIPHNTPNDN